jgi:hypothetical protein
VDESYIVRVEDKVVTRFADFHVFQATTTGRYFFLLVQCKSAGHETQRASWREAVDQLNAYLRGTHGNRLGEERRPVYGIAAVGLYVRFYMYNDPSQDVADWRPSTGGPPLHLVEDHVRIQTALNWIKSNHLIQCCIHSYNHQFIHFPPPHF